METLPEAVPAAELELGLNFEVLEGEEQAFTTEPAIDAKPFNVQSQFFRGWKNDYVANVRALCSGEVAGFQATPLVDADCREPFQFLLEQGAGKVRFGCVKCDGELRLTPTTAPYATCGGNPVCSGLSIAYLHCFLKNDTSTDMFSCLMGVDFHHETYS